MQIDLSQLEPSKLPSADKKRGLSTAGARTGFLSASLVVLGMLTFFFYNFQTVVVTGKSMLPTLKNHQAILICKALWLAGPLKRNDIVVAKVGQPIEYVVKRVYRVGGEEVDDMTLLPIGWDVFDQGTFQVPEDSVYLLGDNRFHSEDSRAFGPVKVRDIVGKMVVY